MTDSAAGQQRESHLLRPATGLSLSQVSTGTGSQIRRTLERLPRMASPARVTQLVALRGGLLGDPLK